MAAGVRLRDAQTGEVVLDLADFTVRVVYSQVRQLPASGSMSVPGVQRDNAGVFVMPAVQTGWPMDPNVYNDEIAKITRAWVDLDTVHWILGEGNPEILWHLLVVRYS